MLSGIEAAIPHFAEAGRFFERPLCANTGRPHNDAIDPEAT